VLQRAAEPRPDHLTSPEPGAEQLEIAEERRQEIVEVVNNPTGELADRLQSLDPIEPLLYPVGDITSAHNDDTLTEINQDGQRTAWPYRARLRYTSVLAPVRSVISR
jgi:hypothetical protein